MSLNNSQLTRLKELFKEFKEHLNNDFSMLYINKEEARILDEYFSNVDHELFAELSDFIFDSDNCEFELSSKDLKFLVSCYENETR
jgi:hypothetical protein